MRDFEDSTLWGISAYERMHAETGHSGFARQNGATALPTTLTSELNQLGSLQRSDDVLEIIAACVRQHENALLLLQHQGLVWPMTVFAQANHYHLPRPIIESLRHGPADLRVIDVEPAGLRPPEDLMSERVAEHAGYRRLPPLLWALASTTPRARLLQGISGRAAYRLVAGFQPDTDAPALALPRAWVATLQRLRSDIASVHDIARWPGMNAERATRLLNGVYLQGGLMVLRTHHAARDHTSRLHRLRHWWPVPRRDA